jgi:hypothetical protein
MSNKNRGEITVRLDRVRTLRFDFNALAEFEDAMGVSMIYAFQSFGDQGNGPDVSMKAVRAMLWAGLLHEEPKLTLRRAGELLEAADGDRMVDKMAYILPKIMEAFTEEFGDKDAKKKMEESKISQYQNEQTGENSKN